ncbi:hypothetical protein Leryth_012601 [Lithospermum erythrorhizon]|nr:hypothetical protein Leryth_012601 [Lithospermum erythrorhizon]
MGFLERIWDETIAGPTPDSGLGKLRKYNSFSASSSKASSMNDQMPISRCIVLKNNYDSGSLPSSPLGSSTPSSPFSPTTPRENKKKLTRRKSMVDPKSPKGYDWIVLCALDR